MMAMVCELCGSSDIIKQDGIYTCQNCGAKYSVEEAKKLLSEVNPENLPVERSVQKQEDSKKDKLLVLARRAREDNNSENAEKYYGMLLMEEPDNWEASFFQVYYKAMQCKIMNISSAANSVSNCLDGNLALIKALPAKEEQDSAVNTVVIYTTMIANMLSNAAVNHYNNHSTANGVFAECVDRVVASANILLNLETALKKHLPENKNVIAAVQESTYDFIAKNARFFNGDWAVNTTTRLVQEIKNVKPGFSKTPLVKVQNSGGCYVATAVYGSYNCPQVWTLRRFRDYTLAETWYGRLFIALYYAISPTLVKWFGETQWFRNMWKPKLDRMVEHLNKEGVADTPYQDRQW